MVGLYGIWAGFENGVERSGLDYCALELDRLSLLDECNSLCLYYILTCVEDRENSK